MRGRTERTRRSSDAPAPILHRPSRSSVSTALCGADARSGTVSGRAHAAEPLPRRTYGEQQRGEQLGAAFAHSVAREVDGAEVGRGLGAAACAVVSERPAKSQTARGGALAWNWLSSMRSEASGNRL